MTGPNSQHRKQERFDEPSGVVPRADAVVMALESLARGAGDDEPADAVEGSGAADEGELGGEWAGDGDKDVVVICPWCQQEAADHPEAAARVQQCMACGQEMIIPSGDGLMDVDETVTPAPMDRVETIETVQGSNWPGHEAVESNLVRRLAMDRRDVIRRRSRAIIGLVLSIAAGVECGLHLGVAMEAGSPWQGKVIWGSGVALAVVCMWMCLVAASRLGDQIKPVKYPHPEREPDFTGLSDGRQVHEHLERVEE